MEVQTNRRDVVSRLTEVTSSLDEYEVEVGLPSHCPTTVTSGAKRLLEISPDQLRHLNAGDCIEGAFVLAQYAFYLQRVVNREASTVRWAQESVDRMVASQLYRQNGQALAERRMLAIANNDAARRAEQLRVEAQLRLDRVSFLAARVESMARHLENLRWARKD